MSEATPEETTAVNAVDDPELLDAVEEAMRDVVDPELMVNVVDLGLVYGIHLDDENNCTIDMTLTSPTCPLTDRLEFDTEMALDGLVNSVEINWAIVNCCRRPALLYNSQNTHICSEIA